ncbi:MAG TPA: response regulator [Myxococcaceae bacterium]|nr:response regulator [Myxococcaceae bacterium]
MQTPPESRTEAPSRVLVVDDAEFVHQLYRVGFRRLGGCELHHARNGREALELLSTAAPFDLIILDIQMPELDGVGVLMGLRELPDQRAAHILISSTETADPRLVEALRGREHTVLTKPFELGKAMTVLEQILNHSRAQGQ